MRCFPQVRKVRDSAFSALAVTVTGCSSSVRSLAGGFLRVALDAFDLSDRETLGLQFRDVPFVQAIDGP